MPRKKLKHVLETELGKGGPVENSELVQAPLNEPGVPIDKISELDKDTNMTDDDIIEISQLKGKETWHYDMIKTFFSTCDQSQIQRMVDIINGNHLISLRFMDWYVTRYCYLYKTTINVANQFCTQNNFNINISYKAQLKSFTKKYFDPFKRKKKFFFTLDKYKISFLTTIGQLNFFRWAITHDVINNTELNYRVIVSKYDYVNSFFKKHISSNASSTSLSNVSTSNVSTSNVSTSNASTSNVSTSNISLSNSSMVNSSIVNGSMVNSDSMNSTKVANDIYSSNNNPNIIVEEPNIKKSISKMPRVSRNIYLEL
jgi:hypothetical protein